MSLWIRLVEVLAFGRCQGTPLRNLFNFWGLVSWTYVLEVRDLSLNKKALRLELEPKGVRSNLFLEKVGFFRCPAFQVGTPVAALNLFGYWRDPSAKRESPKIEPSSLTVKAGKPNKFFILPCTPSRGEMHP